MLNAVQEAIAMGRKCGSIPVKINEFEVKGYRVHRGRYTLASLACLGLGITFGLLLVLLVRRKDINIWMFYKECSLEHTTKILVKVPILTFFSIINRKQENNISKKKSLRILSEFSTKKTYMRKDMGTSCNLKLVV